MNRVPPEKRIENNVNLLVDRSNKIGSGDRKLNLENQFRDLRNVRNNDEFRSRWNEFRNNPQFRNDPILRQVERNRVAGAFQDRLARNDFNNFNSLRFANRVNLNRQFNFFVTGDVGRRMNFQASLIQRGGWRNRYYGPIYSGYRNNAFSIWYPGPRFYPRAVWHPRWSPWVAWSWWNSPLVIYDPRPIYCRPYVYEPAPVWTYYDYPQWQSLPVVASGTWVDVPPVQLEPQQTDLQLLAVRFVDPGHPDEAIGPRFRVWLRNNSQVDVNHPFNVTLLASADRQADASLPQAGVTVEKIAPGETQAVDVRLPFEANRVGKDDQGRNIPFEYVHVLVDANRDVEETNEANNGTLLSREDMLPVDPAAFSADVTDAAPGAVITIAGEGLGPEPGQVVVVYNGQESEAEVYGWYDLGVRFRLPNTPVASQGDAQIIIVRGDGAATNPIDVNIVPESMLGELPPLPQP